MDKISRADLLKTGAAGLTMLSLSGCVPERRVAEEEKDKLDPELIKYRESGHFPTGFHWARDIAVHHGDRWVAGDMAVRNFSQDGRDGETVPFKEAIQAVTVAPGGAVYVATSDAVIPLEGKPWLSLGPRARIVSLVATDDEVIAADAGNREIIVFNKNGTEKHRIDGFIVPSPYFGLAVHEDRMVVSNPGRHRVERYAQGRLETTFGEQGQEIERFCGCCNPTNLAVLPNGDLVTSEKGIPRVKVLSPDGALKAIVAPPTAFNPQAAGLSLAVDGDRVLVLDPWEGAVRVFEPI